MLSHEYYTKILQTLWKVMSNYYEVTQWHKQHEDFLQTEDENDGEASYNKKYVTQKLNHGLHRVWKVKLYYLAFKRENNQNALNYVIC